MELQTRLKIKKIAYLITIGLILMFFYRQGKAPWILALDLWPVSVVSIICAPITLAVQAMTFRLCLPSNEGNPSLLSLVRIWAIAAITSLIAPFVAGLAVRMTLLKQEGISVSNSTVATIHQMWINIEYAWIMGSFILMFYPWDIFPILGYLATFSWICYKMICLKYRSWCYRKNKKKKVSHKFFWQLLSLSQLTLKAKICFCSQIFIMTINYLLSFWLGGATLIWHLSLLLTSITILSSLLIFIPHGLGVLDSLWVFVANLQGLTVDQGVALAITMRLGMFLGYGIVYATITLFKLEARVENSKGA